MPTIGFRIYIVENVRSQNFIENWLSEVLTKILTSLITFRFIRVYCRFCIVDSESLPSLRARPAINSARGDREPAGLQRKTAQAGPQRRVRRTIGQRRSAGVRKGRRRLRRQEAARGAVPSVASTAQRRGRQCAASDRRLPTCTEHLARSPAPQGASPSVCPESILELAVYLERRYKICD